MSSEHTYIGPWINWSHGPVRGSTITLSTRDAGLLTSFLALFVSAAGTAFWKILSYCLHQALTHKAPQNACHQQRQVVLRNTTSAAAAIYQFLRLSWAWRKTAPGPALRSLPLAFLALINLSLFAVAGIFSSQVTKAGGGDRLLISSNCGYSSEARLRSETLGGLLPPTGPSQGPLPPVREARRTKSADDYARDCYGSGGNVMGCGQYVQRHIPWAVNEHASCPFSQDICVSGGTAAYEMDTGRIDSMKALGINRPPPERLSYRKVTTCSPLKWHGKESAQDSQILFLDYGPVSNSNWTFKYNKDNSLASVPLNVDYTIEYVPLRQLARWLY